MTLGERLRELRKEKRKTLREVNDATGIDYSNLSQIERGDHGCNSSTLQILADYYQVTTDYLLGYTDNPKAIKVNVADNTGNISSIDYVLLDKVKGFTVEDMNKVFEYVDFLKAKKEVEKNEK